MPPCQTIDNGDGVKDQRRRQRCSWPTASKKGGFFQHGDDLYYYFLDGSKAVRLTRSTGAKELVSLSPNGQHVAYVRDNNLYVVDIATQTERALTTDGSAVIFNGKMDWVYWEEIGNRRGQCLLVESGFLAPRFCPLRRYAGPQVRRARSRADAAESGDETVSESGRSACRSSSSASCRSPAVRSPSSDLQGYSDGSMLLTRAGWMPDGEKVYFYIQDRAQTWLDFCTVPRRGGAPTRLFREKTKAWVRRSRTTAFSQGRVVSPAERAQRLEAPLSLRQRRKTPRGGDERVVGGAQASSRR